MFLASPPGLSNICLNRIWLPLSGLPLGGFQLSTFVLLLVFPELLWSAGFPSSSLLPTVFHIFLCFRCLWKSQRKSIRRISWWSFAKIFIPSQEKYFFEKFCSAIFQRNHVYILVTFRVISTWSICRKCASTSPIGQY